MAAQPLPCPLGIVKRVSRAPAWPASCATFLSPVVEGVRHPNASGEHKLVAAFADAMRQAGVSAGPYSVGG
ncbi:hypothetical protein [Streptomyces bullii]|uniref:Uncharacterized protein n=1 Tax=Streptomyces bullii TaxID=349910 RepID=A0ABW0UYD8_9ACTN